MVNWSSMPIPASHEFISATLTLHKLSGGESAQESIRIAVCEMYDEWNQSATWNGPTGGNSSYTWGLTGGCDTPFEITGIAHDDYTVDFDITYAVQHAHANGTDKVNLAFWVISDTTDEWHFASSDYTSDESKRPELNLEWRTGVQWLPSKPTGLSPVDESTLWNLSASRPAGADGITFNWTAGESNETRWIAQVSPDPTFTDQNETLDIDFSDNSTFNGTWDHANLSYTVDELEDCDCWIYWRIRADQDYRLGKWSERHSYRVPDDIGYDDGAGNNTVTLYQGSVFEDSGDLPGVPDATIDSNRPNSALGDNGQLDLGISAAGSGESKIILTFDLSELPFPTAMTPTNALLSLYRHNVTGTSSLTVSAHACDTFARRYRNLEYCSYMFLE